MTFSYPTSPVTTTNPEILYLGDPAGISAFAEAQANAANTYLLKLGDASAALTPPTIDPEFPVGPAAPGQLISEIPTFQPIVWTSPDAPPAFTENLDVTDIMPEPFDSAPPVLSFATAPAEFTDAAPDAPAVTLAFDDPTLTVNLPSAPSLLSINITPFDGMNLPTIDPDAIPQLTVVAPSVREYIPGAQYTSSLLTSVRAYLQDIIDNGGTGLNADVENAIWDRGREREARAAREALDKLDEMEAMGFALPPGAYVDARLKVITETDYAERGLSREVMIKQAELAYAASKDMTAAAIELEAKSMDYANAVEQRLFESTKYATEAGIAIYNARVQAYAAYLDAYKTKVQIYQAQVQAEVAKVDAYRAQVQAEEAKAQVNTALVEQYKAQVDAAMANVRIFEAEIAAIQTKAMIEKTKVEIFGEQVRGYAARINAYTASVEGYRATLEAEKTKQDVYVSQVEAYRARVEAAARTIDTRIAAYRGRLDANISLWTGYKAAIEGEAAKAQAISSFNSSLADEYKAEVAAVTSYNETLTKQWQVAIDQAQRVTDIGVSAAKANAELYMTTRSLALDAAKVGSQVSAQLGAAALNAINWSTSHVNSNSWSSSSGVNMSYSAADSQSTNYNYNYSASV